MAVTFHHMPKLPVDKTTNTFLDFAQAVKAKGLKFDQAKAGITLDLGNNISATFAVVELPDQSTMDVPLMELPNGTKPSDCLEYTEGKFIYDPEETQRRKAEIKRLMDSMWND